MTIEELLNKTPEPLRPIIAKYGPALVAMTAQEFADWLELLIVGRNDEAMATILARLDNADLIARWKAAAADWKDAAAANAAAVKLQKEAGLAVLKVLLAAGLAMVGL